MVRGYPETRHAAGSWDRERHVVARIEATELGLDTRYVVTSLGIGSAQWIYDSLYCARGQAENLIKLHKTQTRVRSHQLPFRPCQPGSPRLPYRRLCWGPNGRG